MPGSFWVRILAAILLAWLPAAAARIPHRYIVELDTAPVAEAVARFSPRRSLRSSEAQAHRSRIRSEQAALKRQLEARKVRVLDSVDTVANALFIDVPDDDVSLLSSLPGIKRLSPVRTVRMLLDHAVKLTGAVAAWNQLGQEHAGEGVKIAIIDSGIDPTHPGLQPGGLAAPEGYPKVGSDADLPYTNGKIIVARSYVSLLASRDPDYSPRDHVGHGTALAMAAAGIPNAGPLGTISGVAPRAYLGNYKIFGTPGFNDNATNDAILKALDDAVADGMDIINLSLGDDFASRLSDDIEVQAVERASQAGVIVVAAAGNSGPELNTISSPATAPSVISVGASTNDRTYAFSVEVAGIGKFVALAGDGPAPTSPVAAPLADVAPLDGSGRACDSLPPKSLENRIALILRGNCTFELKLIHAQQAGAVAAVVYAAPDSPDPVSMAVGAATLPALMVSNADGRKMQQAAATQPPPVATLRFTRDLVPIEGNRLASFSAAGPNVDLSIKPDLLATGTDLYIATQSLDPRGDMYDPSGYALVDGTSFSAPLVAGAAAVVKSARPGLTVDQYRSLLINTAQPVTTSTGETAPVQRTGAGVLDVGAALRSTAALSPVSLSFGAGGPAISAEASLTITNLGETSEMFTISVAPLNTVAAPTVALNTLEIPPHSSAAVPVTWNASSLTPGAYDGFLTVTGVTSGAVLRAPYWYASTDGVPATIHIMDSIDSARRGSLQKDAILFRVTDVAGVPVAGVAPVVTVLSGGGAIRRVVSYDSQTPGLFGVDVILGATPGLNVIRIQVGSVTADVTIQGL